MDLLLVQNMGVKNMPVAKSSLYRKVKQQQAASSQAGPTPVIPSQPMPPPSGAYALAAAGDHSHANTFVPAQPIRVTASQGEQGASADVRKDLEAWKKLQAEKYEKQFLKYKEDAKTAAADAEQQRNQELAVIRQENVARSADMERLNTAMDTFQRRLMDDFGKVLDERMAEVGQHQKKMAAEFITAQELAADRFATMEANMKLLMDKLIGPTDGPRATGASSPGSSPATKKAKADELIPAHSLDGGAKASKKEEGRRKSSRGGPSP